MGIKIALVGIGKIARDQHLPTLAKSPDFTLAAAASHHGRVEGVDNFTSLAELLDAKPEIEAVSLCTPPSARFEDARLALAAGKHVLLEKPPGATVSEVEALVALAKSKAVALHASWHSRHAPAVEPATAWLKDKTLKSVRCTWTEDVRHWHPGQNWLLEPGGLGVFDPGINALSILTAILPEPFALKKATLETPSNRQTPLKAELEFAMTSGAPLTMKLDFLEVANPAWTIEAETDAGTLSLTKGGADLSLAGAPAALGPNDEYAGVYAHFADLARQRRVDVDLSPLQHCADAFLLGAHRQGAAFEW